MTEGSVEALPDGPKVVAEDDALPRRGLIEQPNDGADRCTHAARIDDRDVAPRHQAHRIRDRTLDADGVVLNVLACTTGRDTPPDGVDQPIRAANPLVP